MATERRQRSLPTHARPPRCHRCPPRCADGARPTNVLLGAGPSLLILRQRSAAFVRTLRRYYGPLRLLRPVHVGRAALAFTHRPAVNSRAGRKSPGSRAESFLTCTGSSTAPGPTAAHAIANGRCGLPFQSTRSAPETSYFTAQSPGPPVPLSTLRPRCHHRRRMTRGQRGSLLLHCGAPSSPTLCRFTPALSDCPLWAPLGPLAGQTSFRSGMPEGGGRSGR